MAYVNMTKDFSEMRKPIPGLGITKRQLIAFAVGAGLAIPIFLLLKPYLELTYRVMIIGIIVFPICFILLRKKDGMYMEVHIRYWFETHFIRNTDRPYETENLYDLLMEEIRIKEEHSC